MSVTFGQLWISLWLLSWFNSSMFWSLYMLQIDFVWYGALRFLDLWKSQILKKVFMDQSRKSRPSMCQCNTQSHHKSWLWSHTRLYILTGCWHTYSTMFKYKCLILMSNSFGTMPGLWWNHGLPTVLLLVAIFLWDCMGTVHVYGHSTRLKKW